MDTLGSRVIALRTALGYSQRKLARLIGIAQPSLSNIESDNTKQIKGETLAGLVEHLRTTQDFILYGANGQSSLEDAMIQAEIRHNSMRMSHEQRQELLRYSRYLLSVNPSDSGNPQASKKVSLNN